MKRTKYLLIGFMLGIALGTVLSAYAAQRIVGDSGYLIGWDVVALADGHLICSDPFVWTATREIEYD